MKLTEREYSGRTVFVRKYRMILFSKLNTPFLTTLIKFKSVNLKHKIKKVTKILVNSSG